MTNCIIIVFCIIFRSDILYTRVSPCVCVCVCVVVCHRGGGHKPREGQREDVHDVVHPDVPRHDQQEVPVRHEAGVRGPGGEGKAAQSVP